MKVYKYRSDLIFMYWSGIVSNSGTIFAIAMTSRHKSMNSHAQDLRLSMRSSISVDNDINPGFASLEGKRHKDLTHRDRCVSRTREPLLIPEGWTITLALRVVRHSAKLYGPLTDGNGHDPSLPIMVIERNGHLFAVNPELSDFKVYADAYTHPDVP